MIIGLSHLNSLFSLRQINGIAKPLVRMCAFCAMQKRETRRSLRALRVGRDT
jgi:hypothetical protein